VADAWSRTYRSRAVTISRTDDALLTLRGIAVRYGMRTAEFVAMQPE
jgi:hypothetical protein